MRSWLSRTARVRCKRELYRPPSTPKTACRVPRAEAACTSGTMTSRSGHETHRHDYSRPPASLGDELGGLITSLGLFASPPLVLSTESVVMMERKVLSMAIMHAQESRRGTRSAVRSRRAGAVGQPRAEEVGRSIADRRTPGASRSVGRWQIPAVCDTRVATW